MPPSADALSYFALLRVNARTHAAHNAGENARRPLTYSNQTTMAYRPTSCPLRYFIVKMSTPSAIEFPKKIIENKFPYHQLLFGKRRRNIGGVSQEVSSVLVFS